MWRTGSRWSWVATQSCRDKPLVLFFNNFFDRPVDTAAFSCGECCQFTTDRSELHAADAVVFHIPSLGRARKVRKYPGQLWVAWCMESRVSYPALADPSFMRNFDIRMTYEKSADIWCPYLPSEQTFERALATPIPAKTASAPAVMLQSTPFDRSGRNEFAIALMAHMNVHSYGRFLNNRRKETLDLGRETKLALIGSYKFCLGFENSIAEDYVTEKLFDPLVSGSVPVYRGAPNADMFAPGDNCFIDASKFSSPRKLAEYLIHLDNDTAAYEKLLVWRRRGLAPRFKALLSKALREPFCRLCDMVIERRPGRRAPSWMRHALARRIALR
jgi:hypothetical protein